MEKPFAVQTHSIALDRGTFFQIYYYGSNKSTGMATEKTHLCALEVIDMR
jgi:hypothetical protein